jgi:hypothetical protein
MAVAATLVNQLGHLVQFFGGQSQGMDFTTHPAAKGLVDGLMLLDKAEPPEGFAGNTYLPVVSPTGHVCRFHFCIGERLKQALFNLGCVQNCLLLMVQEEVSTFDRVYQV